MQIEEHNELVSLFDLYGELLSNKQKEVIDKFLNLDIAEIELAQLLGESRQSVHDAITKAKKQLLSFEQKCGFLKNRADVKKEFENLRELLEKNETNQALEKVNKLINNF